jgi:hypothetical protein
MIYAKEIADSSNINKNENEIRIGRSDIFLTMPVDDQMEKTKRHTIIPAREPFIEFIEKMATIVTHFIHMGRWSKSVTIRYEHRNNAKSLGV